MSCNVLSLFSLFFLLWIRLQAWLNIQESPSRVTGAIRVPTGLGNTDHNLKGAELTTSQARQVEYPCNLGRAQGSLGGGTQGPKSARPFQ